jgi:hypothetical protein
MSYLIIILILFNNIFVFGEETSEEKDNTINISEQTNTYYNTYYNNYYLNDYNYDYMDIFSLNNKNNDSYYRPKYSDLSKSLKDYIETSNKNIKVNKNSFDQHYNTNGNLIEWSDINKEDKPTSRALEILGYDFMLSHAEMNTNTGEIEPIVGYGYPINSKTFIMNIYKSLNLEIYDIFFNIYNNTSECGVSISRSNSNQYWKKFLNDHPINYNVYSNSIIENETQSNDTILKTYDAIVILAEMLEFYGEPVISKQEEYLLLQIYGDDVPRNLTNQQREAWSYLKCRGIIGDTEFNYEEDLSFNTMLDLLMRVKDKESRFDFKEVQITTNLDNSFVKSGYYERDVDLEYKPLINVEVESIDFSDAIRYDYLIEINDDIKFKDKDTNILSKSLFISYEQNANAKAIEGSIYHGVIDNKFYHFSVPITKVKDKSYIYVNSKNSNDLPKVYNILSTGGLYLDGKSNSENSVTFSKIDKFSNSMPESMYVDESRKDKNTLISKYLFNKIFNLANKAYAREILDSDGIINPINITLKIKNDYIDVDKTINNLKSKISSTILSSITNNNNELSINLKNFYTSYENATEFLNEYIIVKEEYKSNTSGSSKAVLCLTGDKLLIDLDEAKSLNLIKGYEPRLDDDALIIYKKGSNNSTDIIIVDNINKTIQKGNTYLQIREDQQLFIYRNGKYMVDFRALYGSKEVSFRIVDDSQGKTIVTMYENLNLFTNNNSSDNSYLVGDYMYFNTKQTLPYKSTEYNSNIDSDSSMNIDMLYKKNSNNYYDSFLPFSSNNPLGNYILYGEFNYNEGKEDYYLVLFTPKGLLNNNTQPLLQRNYEELFRFITKDILDKYIIDVIKVEYKDNSRFRNIPNIGWCYILQDTTNDSDSFIRNFMSRSSRFPLTIQGTGSSRKLINYNVNKLYEDGTIDNFIKYPNSSFSNVVPAIVGVQSFVTNSKFISTLSDNSKEAIKNYNSEFYFGTLKLIKRNDSLVTQYGNIDVSTNKDIKFLSMNKILKNSGTLYNPGIYMVLPNDYNITYTQHKQEIKYEEIDKISIDLQKFFDKFEDISFLNFIRDLDTKMSLVYYIFTRVVPLIILSLLVILTIIAFVSDMRIVQLFCTKVFDPVKILTFGHYDIQTVKNRFLVVSLTIALIFMGFIQAGNLEKLILFCVRFYFAAKLFFN